MDTAKMLTYQLEQATAVEAVEAIERGLEYQRLTVAQREMLQALARARRADLGAPAGVPAPAGLPPHEPNLVPRPPSGPLEALANIKRAELGAVRTQLGRGLVDESGKLVALDEARMMLTLGICVTYGLQPAGGDIMLMGGEPYPTAPKGVVKIIRKNPLFRAWLKKEWVIEDDVKKRYKVRGGARFKDSEHPDDPGRDTFVIEEGYADAGNVTAMLRNPKGGGADTSGFIRDMAENRMLRKVQELSTPVEVDWSKVGVVVAGAPAGDEKHEPETTSGSAGAGADASAATGQPDVVAGAADDIGATTAATEAQVNKIRQLAKSSEGAVQALKQDYQERLGLDPSAWPKAEAARFIDAALGALGGPEGTP